MADSILDTVNAAYDSLETPEAAPAPEVVTEAPAEQPVETDEQKAERARDEAGRFAKQPKENKPRETLKLKEKPQEPASPAAGSVSATPPAPAAPLDLETDKDGKILAKIPVPQEWSGVAKIKWDQLPRPIREEIVKHETARMAATQDLLPVKELVDVNREFLVNQAGSVPEAMRQMMQFARMSVDNPVQLAEHILRARGIDPRQAFAGQQGAPQQAQPTDLQSLVAQLVEQRLQPFQAQAEQQQTQQLESTINQFAADPKRPFFNDVRFHMGQLISAGAAKSLEEAYEQATWANPTIRAHLLEEQRGATEKANAAQVQKAQQARRASVTGSPLAGVVAPDGKPKGNVRDVVAQLYDDLSGA